MFHPHHYTITKKKTGVFLSTSLLLLGPRLKKLLTIFHLDSKNKEDNNKGKRNFSVVVVIVIVIVIVVVILIEEFDNNNNNNNDYGVQNLPNKEL